MAVEIPQIIPAIHRNGLAAPELIARLPQPVIDNLTHLTNYVDMIPGIRTGELFRKIYQADPSAWMPNEQLINSMLFAGEGSQEGLKRRVYAKLRYTEERFPRVGQRSFLDSETNTRFRSMPIIRILHAVEEITEGMTRRTGEKAFCHVLRCVDRGIDYIRLINRIRASGSYCLYFNPRVAEMLLASLALHDLSEEKRKTADNAYKRGRVIAEYDSWGKSGLRLQDYSVTDDNADQAELLKEWFVRFDSPYLGFLAESLIQVDTDRFPEDEKMKQVIAQHTDYSDKLNLSVPPQLMLHFVPIVTKDLDRNDNLATYYFTEEGGVYRLTDPEKIVDKAREQLDEFAPLEGYFTFVNADFYNELTSYETIFGIEPVYHFFKSASSNHPEILKMLPTRWARLTLLGVNPNQLYGKTPTWGTYSHLPVMI